MSNRFPTDRATWFAKTWGLHHYRHLVDLAIDSRSDPWDISLKGDPAERLVKEVAAITKPHARPFTDAEQEYAFNLCHLLHGRGALEESAQAYLLLNDALLERGILNDRNVVDEDAKFRTLNFNMGRRAEILMDLGRFDEAKDDLTLLERLLEEQFQGDTTDWSYTSARESLDRGFTDVKAGLGRTRKRRRSSGAQGALIDWTRYWREHRLGAVLSWAERLSNCLNDLAWDADSLGLERLVSEWDEALSQPLGESQLVPWFEGFALDLECLAEESLNRPRPDRVYAEHKHLPLEVKVDEVATWEGRPVFVIGTQRRDELPPEDTSHRFTIIFGAPPEVEEDLGDEARLAIIYPPAVMSAIAAELRTGRQLWLPFVMPMHQPELAANVSRLAAAALEQSEGSMQSGEFLANPVTAEDLCLLFNDAYYIARVDDDGDVVVEADDLTIVVRAFGHILQIFAAFSVPDSLERSEIIESVNEANAGTTIPRAVFVQGEDGGGVLVYDWSLPLLEPVRKRDLVESFRVFLAATAEAAQESGILSADD